MRLVLYKNLCKISRMDDIGKALFNVNNNNNNVFNNNNDNNNNKFGKRRHDECSDTTIKHQEEYNDDDYYCHGVDLSLEQLLGAFKTYNNNNIHKNNDIHSLSSSLSSSSSSSSSSYFSFSSHLQKNTNEITKQRLLIRLNPTSIDDVARQFELLDDFLVNNLNNNLNHGPIFFDLDMVIVQCPPDLLLLQNINNITTTSNNSAAVAIDQTIEYLYQILPHGAKFLERHASVGNFEKHGQCNAHGKPMDRHVIGVCHDLKNVFYNHHHRNHHNQQHQHEQQFMSASSVSSASSSSSFMERQVEYMNFLSQIVDILPPTRLSISAPQTFLNTSFPTSSTTSSESTTISTSSTTAAATLDKLHRHTETNKKVEEKKKGDYKEGINNDSINSMDWEDLQQSTDHLDFSGYNHNEWTFPPKNNNANTNDCNNNNNNSIQTYWQTNNNDNDNNNNHHSLSSTNTFRENNNNNNGNNNLFCSSVWKWQYEIAEARETYVSYSDELSSLSRPYYLKHLFHRSITNNNDNHNHD